MKPSRPYILNKAPNKREKTSNKIEGPTSKKTNEPPQEGESQRGTSSSQTPSGREKHIKEGNEMKG
jgi:hypothetical protein